jgi:hypothetical protein
LRLFEEKNVKALTVAVAVAMAVAVAVAVFLPIIIPSQRELFCGCLGLGCVVGKNVKALTVAVVLVVKSDYKTYPNLVELF